MRKEQRLRRWSDFAAVYRQGRMQGNRLLVLRVRPTGAPVTRFGFVVGKPVGSAVVRNRVKRRLRAIAARLPARDGLDIVVGARATAAVANFASLEQTFASLMRRSGAARDAGGKSAPAAEETS